MTGSRPVRESAFSIMDPMNQACFRGYCARWRRSLAWIHRTFSVVLLLSLCLDSVPARATEAPAVDRETQGTAGNLPQAAGAAFDVLEFRVLGNTVLDARTIEAAVTPFLGPARHFSDVEAARSALETAYHDHGFGTVFIDVPEQSVEDGIVRLQVTEGRLHAAAIGGAKYFSERQIRAAVPEARAGQVPDLAALQSQLAKVNAATPDRAVIPVLKAGPLPGTVDLALNVDDHLPLHGSLELNNQYTPDTKPLRAVGVLSYDNLFGQMHSLSMQYQYAPQEPKDAGVFAAGYVAPLAVGKIAATYIHSSSDITTVSALGVLGKGSIYGLHYDYPVSATPTYLADITVGADYKRFAQTAGTLPSPISYLDLSAVYAGTFTTEQRVYTWSTGPSFSIRGVGAPPLTFADKCFECRQNYFVVRADGSVTQHLPGHFDAVLRGAGQYSVTPLVSNEQFLMGGAQTIRGYYEAEALGDRGLRGSVELRAPNLVRGDSLAHVVPFAFFDAGDVNYVSPLSGQPPRIYLASAGGGIAIGYSTHLQGQLVYAHALKTTPEATSASSGSKPAPPPTHTQSGDSRLLFQLKGSF